MWEVRVSAVDGDHHLTWAETYHEAWEFACNWLAVPMKYGHMQEVSMYGDTLYVQGDEKIMAFSEYVHKISSKEKITFIEKTLDMAPDYFWYIPASSSGKHHPSFAQGEGGLVRHTIATLMIANQLFLAYPQTDRDKDDIIIALILHDTLKRGYPDTGKTVAVHPLLPREYYRKLSGIIGEKPYSRIMDLIETHMGIWHTPPKPEYGRISPAEIVHLADFMTNRPLRMLEEWGRRHKDK